ncbi:MAG: FHA domain-containing protein [Phototrophicaceae bacterium]
MRSCTQCGFANREGYLFCEDCGFPLLSNSRDAKYRTQQLNEEDRKSIRELQLAPPIQQMWQPQNGITNDTSQINLVLNGETFIFDLRTMPKIILGRSDTSSTTLPDFDLSPFGALNQGVSRLHATIECIETSITITDMASSNGTYINRKLLASHQPQILHDGDEVRLGKLVLNIYFIGS